MTVSPSSRPRVRGVNPFLRLHPFHQFCHSYLENRSTLRRSFFLGGGGGVLVMLFDGFFWFFFGFFLFFFRFFVGGGE